MVRPAGHFLEADAPQLVDGFGRGRRSSCSQTWRVIQPNFAGNRHFFDLWRRSRRVCRTTISPLFLGRCRDLGTGARNNHRRRWRCALGLTRMSGLPGSVLRWVDPHASMVQLAPERHLRAGVPRLGIGAHLSADHFVERRWSPVLRPARALPFGFADGDDAALTSPTPMLLRVLLPCLGPASAATRDQQRWPTRSGCGWVPCRTPRLASKPSRTRLWVPRGLRLM